MDRFIELKELKKQAKKKYLKSSMDRFIDSSDSVPKDFRWFI